VYSGYSFWQSLMRLDLIDVFYLSLTPYAAGECRRLFDKSGRRESNPHDQLGRSVTLWAGHLRRRAAGGRRVTTVSDRARPTPGCRGLWYVCGTL